MIALNDELLDELGLALLPVDQKTSFLDHVYDTLETRVGLAIAEGLTADQMDEFGELVDAEDDVRALKWLETNVPSYRELVARTLDTLKAEISANAEAIIAASTA